MATPPDEHYASKKELFKSLYNPAGLQQLIGMNCRCRMVIVDPDTKRVLAVKGTPKRPTPCAPRIPIPPGGIGPPAIPTPPVPPQPAQPLPTRGGYIPQPGQPAQQSATAIPPGIQQSTSGWMPDPEPCEESWNGRIVRNANFPAFLGVAIDTKGDGSGGHVVVLVSYDGLVIRTPRLEMYANEFDMGLAGNMFNDDTRVSASAAFTLGQIILEMAEGKGLSSSAIHAFSDISVHYRTMLEIKQTHWEDVHIIPQCHDEKKYNGAKVMDITKDMLRGC